MNLFWLWILVFQGFLYCAIFGYLLGRYQWRWDSFLIALPHLFLGISGAAAPARCLLDSNYVGYQSGFLKADGGFACILALLVLGWAISSAYISVIAPRGKWLAILVVADLLMFLNHAGTGIKVFLASGFTEFTWQGGAYWKFSGVWVGVLWQLLITVPLLLSAIWFAFRVFRENPLRGRLAENTG